MTGAIVALERGSLTQYTAGIGVTMLGAILQCWFQPYFENVENILALLVEGNTFLIIYVAFVGSLDEDLFEGSSGKDTGILLAVITCLVIFISLAIVNLAVFSKSKHSQFKAGMQSVGLTKGKTAKGAVRRESDGGVELLELAPNVKATNHRNSGGTAATPVHEGDLEVLFGSGGSNEKGVCGASVDNPMLQKDGIGRASRTSDFAAEMPNNPATHHSSSDGESAQVDVGESMPMNSLKAGDVEGGSVSRSAGTEV